MWCENELIKEVCSKWLIDISKNYLSESEDISSFIDPLLKYDSHLSGYLEVYIIKLYIYIY